MGLFRSRFTNNSARQVFHSSGVVGDTDGETIGSTNTESFEQRQHVERNRRMVGGYRDAGIVHTYRQEARETLSGRADSSVVQEQRKKSMVTDRATSRVYNVPSSRIDIVKPSSRVARDTTGVAKPGTSAARPTVGVKRTFIEPVTRKYNPYQ